MVDSPIPVKVTLQDEQGNVVASATVMAPGSHTFKDLTPGATYQVQFSAPAPYQVKPPNPDRYTLKNDQNAVKITVGLDCIIVPDPAIEGLSLLKKDDSIRDSGDPSNLSVVLASAAVIGLSVAVLADISGFVMVRSPVPSPAPSFQIRSQVSDRFANVTDRSTNRVTRGDRRLPRDLEERLQKCLEEAFKSQSELLQQLEETGLSLDPAALVPLLLGVEQEEPTDPAIELIQKLKGAIEECDPSLIEEILEAEQENADSPPFTEASQATGTQYGIEPSTAINCCVCADGRLVAQLKDCPESDAGSVTNEYLITANQIWIIGSDVNVRAAPHLNSPIVAQISKGVVAVDRTSATVEGWLPIILPDGQRGYISTQFVSFSAPN